MSDCYVKLNKPAVRDEILNADFMVEECAKKAEEKARETYSNGYHIKKFKGTQRAHAIAFPNTKDNPQ